MAAAVKKEAQINRRQFVSLAWGLSFLGVLGQSAFSLFQFLRPRPDAGGFGGTVTAGELGEFTPGSMSYVRKGRFYLMRQDDGGVLALWQRCTHLGCTVPWREELGSFLCPCHSSRFNPQGEVVGGPAPRPLDIFQVRMEEGTLLVDTSRAIERQSFHPTQLFYPSEGA